MGDEKPVTDVFMVLRLPPAQAERMREMLRAPVEDDKGRLKFDTQVAFMLSSQDKLPKFKFGDQIFPLCSLVQLPAVVEVMKSADGGKRLYKAGDGSHMLVVHEDDTDAQRFNVTPELVAVSGLTPPMRG